MDILHEKSSLSLLSYSLLTPETISLPVRQKRIVFVIKVWSGRKHQPHTSLKIFTKEG